MAMEGNNEDHRLEDPVGVARNSPLYVYLEYAGSMDIVIPTTDRGMDPNSQHSDKSFFTIIQCQRSIKFTVLDDTDFVGTGEIPLDDVLSLGLHDYFWPLGKGENNRAGELRVILHYPDANRNEVRPSSSTRRYLPPPAGYSPATAPVPSHARPLSPYPPTPPHSNHHPAAYQYHYQPVPSPYNYHLPPHQYLPAHQYPPAPSPNNYHLPAHQYPPAHLPHLHPPPTPPSNHVPVVPIIQSAAALAQILTALPNFFGS